MDFEIERIEVRPSRQGSRAWWNAYVFGTGTDAYVLCASGISAGKAVENVLSDLGKLGAETAVRT